MVGTISTNLENIFYNLHEFLRHRHYCLSSLLCCCVRISNQLLTPTQNKAGMPLLFVLFFCLYWFIYKNKSHMRLTYPVVPGLLPLETSAQAKQRSFSTSDTWWSIVLVFRFGSYGEGTISQVFEETQLKLAGWLRTNGGHPWMMSDWQHRVDLMYLLARDVHV